MKVKLSKPWKVGDVKGRDGRSLLNDEEKRMNLTVDSHVITEKREKSAEFGFVESYIFRPYSH